MDQEMNYWIRRGVEATPGLEEIFDEFRKDRQNQNRSDERNQLSFTGRTVPYPSRGGKDPVYQAVKRRLLRQKLISALLNLSEKEWDLIIMYFFEEKTEEEIGRSLGISKMAVCKRLKKTIARMRGLMEA